MTRHHPLFWGPLALAFLSTTAVSAPATGTPGVYTTAGGVVTPGIVVQTFGLENGNGVLCLVGSDATCQLPGSGGGGLSAVTVADGSDVAEGSILQGVCAGDTTSGCSLEQRFQRLTAQLTAFMNANHTDTTGALPTQVPTVSIGGAGAMVNGTTSPLIQATASVPITFTAAGGPTQIIAASGSKVIYITHIHYVVSGVGTFALITGTGTNCGTGTTYLEGSSGHPLSFAANSGISAGGGLGPIYVTAAAGEICAITTGSVDTSGVISYAQF